MHAAIAVLQLLPLCSPSQPRRRLSLLHTPAPAARARLAPDAASVAGLLHLRKLPGLGTLAPPAPEVALHLVRHRRRRLAISPVEIDPGAMGCLGGECPALTPAYLPGGWCCFAAMRSAPHAFPPCHARAQMPRQQTRRRHPARARAWRRCCAAAHPRRLAQSTFRA